VLKKVRPSPEDRARLHEISDSIISRIEDLAEERGLSLKAMLVGSAARNTWLAGDHDLDIFLGIPSDADLSSAMEIARLVAPDHEEKYAEHPYVHARVDGFEVDLVPCYLVPDASSLKSSVDRTPFHTEYVARRIVGLEDDVLLLKQFMKGIEVYGSELKVGGFSGYLAELLVLFFGSFQRVLQAASSWKPGELLDLINCKVNGSCDRRSQHLEGLGKEGHEEPLVVVDPVDPRRNVAAALTLDRMLQFSAASRCFLAEPSLDFFFPDPVAPLSDDELAAQINERKSLLILVDFQAPAVVEDVLFPQLRKAEESVKALLERYGFRMLRSDVVSYRDRAAILIEMEVWELSRVCRRCGPPVWEAAHQSRFLAAHPLPLSGPYIADGRSLVETARKFTRAEDLLAAEIGNISLGRHLSSAIRCGHNIYVGFGLASIKDEDFRIFLARYFQAKNRIC